MHAIYERLCICVCASFPFGFYGRMWDLIVLIPDYFFSIYFGVILFVKSISKCFALLEFTPTEREGNYENDRAPSPDSLLIRLNFIVGPTIEIY